MIKCRWQFIILQGSIKISSTGSYSCNYNLGQLERNKTTAPPDFNVGKMLVVTTNVDPSFVGWRGRGDLNFHFTLSMIVDGIYSTLRGGSKTRGKKFSVQGHWKICRFEGMVELMTLNTLVKWCNDGCLATGEKVIEKISEIRVEIEATISITHQRPVSRTSRVTKIPLYLQEKYGSSFETWQLFYLSLYLEDIKKAAFHDKWTIGSRIASRAP